MVRETIISAATLAGLVGLACLYNTATSPVDLARSDRIARAAEEFAIDSDFIMDEANDTDFFADFDMNENDVMQFQNNPAAAEQEERAGGAKKQISQVKNCLRNVKCTERAQAAVKKWASNSASYISANPSRLLKPIATSINEEMEEGFENDFGMCTPNDDSVPCNDDAGNMDNYNNHFNADPKNQFSTNADIQAQIEDLAETSAALADGLESAASPINAVRVKTNAFSKRAAKVFLVIPNGVPVSMPQSYQSRFGNYWRWFKDFNTRYIGAGLAQKGANRVNMHFWFLRQDKNLKMVMKSPAKVSVRFPWKRFDSIMLPNQNTAAQPKIAPTLETLYSTISDKGFASDFTAGQDCFTIWFHQYIPQDILDLSDSLFQEEIMKPLEKTCAITHVWVGANALEDNHTVRTIQYIQGLLQPEQLSTTSADPVRRRYYFVDDLEALSGEAGENLMDQIYSDIAVERSRASCLLSTGGNDLGLAFERANERYDEYYAYGDEGITTTMEDAYSVATSEGAVVADDYELAYDEATTTGVPESITSTAEPLPNNWKCCGIGFSGKKFDSNAQACCDDGSIADSEADCFLL